MDRLRRIAFAAVVVVVVLAGLEGLARAAMKPLVFRILPSEQMRQFVTETELVYDPSLGWVPAAGLQFERTLHFDPHLHSRDHAGIYRGFVLGDSQALGAGLTADEAYSSVAERDLRADGIEVQVLNAAVAGYRSGQVLRMIESRLLAWQPDFLVIDCMVGDGPPLPRDFGGAADTVGRALFYSRLYRLLWLGVAAARGDSLGPIGEPTIESPTESGAKGVGNHALIAALGRSRGIDVVFVDYPFVDDPARSLAPADRLPEGFPVVPATAALGASGKSGQELFLDNNHLTAAGAEVVGRALADTLAPLLRARPLPE